MLHVHVCTYMYALISFHVFVLWCLVLFVEIEPYVHSERVYLSEMLIFLQ